MTGNRLAGALERGLVLLLTVVAALVATSCSSDGFGSVRGHRRLAVELLPPSNPGTRVQPLALAINVASTFRVKVRALNIDGSLDTTFNRYVRISSKPGAIEPLAKTEKTEGRNLLVENGESVEVDVRVVNAFGTSFILADDLGYTPVDPLNVPRPQCANGKDDDGDGRIDAPADEGCAFSNDDSEQGGTFAEGASPPIFFQLPRIADVRGLKCEPTLGCSSNGLTPYPKEQILVDTGYDDRAQAFLFNTVASRISSDGFYASDLNDARGGFNSVFAFNFNPPPRMRVCDRFKSLGGTASEFFGFTQLSYPTWTLEEWEPSARRCLVPDSQPLRPLELQDTANLLKFSGNIVRVETTPGSVLDKGICIGGTCARVTPKLGPNDMPRTGTAFVPGENATNCDLNKDGKIDFSVGSAEAECSDTCASDPECSEWSNFAARGTFRITVTDSNGASKAIQADASASAGFGVVALKGKELRHFAGTLTFFSGGSQFTIEARCKEDIVIEASTKLNAPAPAASTSLSVENAAVFAVGDLVRVSPAAAPTGEDHLVASVEGNRISLKTALFAAFGPGDRVGRTPLGPDAPCTDNSQCPKQTNPDLPPIECRPLRNGERACRWLDPGRAQDGSEILRSPELACVNPRTIFENNPQ